MGPLAENSPPRSARVGGSHEDTKAESERQTVRGYIIAAPVGLDALLKPTRQPPRKPRLFYGWVIVAVAALGSFSASTETYPVLSIFLKPITEDFGWTRTQFAGALTIGGIVGSGAALATGPIVDRFGPRWALAGSYAVIGASFVALAWVTDLWQFYGLQIVARSLNTGVLSVATAVIVPNWFIIKRGRATAFASLGFPAGAALMPLIIALVTESFGWRSASATAGVMILVISAGPTALFLRRRPEDMGLMPDGAPPEKPNDTPSGDLRVPVEDHSMRLGEAAHHPALYLLIAAISIWWFGRTGVTLHAVPYMTDNGLSNTVAVTALVIHAAVGAIGTLVAGFLRDHIRVQYLLAGDFLLNGMAFLLLLAVDTPTLAIAWGVFYGFAQGGSVPLQRLAFADYFGRRHLGSIEGVARAVTNWTQAAGPIAASLAFDLTDSYRIIFIVFLVSNIAAAALAAIANPPKPPSTRERPGE